MRRCSRIIIAPECVQLKRRILKKSSVRLLSFSEVSPSKVYTVLMLTVLIVLIFALLALLAPVAWIIWAWRTQEQPPPPNKRHSWTNVAQSGPVNSLTFTPERQ